MTTAFHRVPWRFGASMYEVNIRQYTKEGTFEAFSKHLPRLKEMGVDVLWLMPVTPISEKIRQGTLGSYYACSSYMEINPEFGDIHDFKNLVSDAHDAGMKIIIDWVANHTGWDHHWTAEHPEWFVTDDEGNFTERNGWHDVIDLDYTVPALRTAMINALKFWVSACDIDGFRCDMAHLVPLDFWHEARTACDELKPLLWLAECEVPEYHTVFDISYGWEWMHESEKLIKHVHDFSKLKNVMFNYLSYPDEAQKLLFTSNHDENSWNGTEYEKYGTAAKTFAVITCLWPGMPLVYSGQELPLVKRLKFFDKDEIEWTANIKLHEFYKLLLHLRKTHPVFEKGIDPVIIPANNDKVFVYMLSNGAYKIMVLLNMSEENRVHITLENELLPGSYFNLFSGLSHHFTSKEIFELQAWEYLVYCSA